MFRVFLEQCQGKLVPAYRGSYSSGHFTIVDGNLQHCATCTMLSEKQLSLKPDGEYNFVSYLFTNRYENAML